MESIEVGVDVSVSRKQNPSASVPVTGRGGAGPSVRLLHCVQSGSIAVFSNLCFAFYNTDLARLTKIDTRCHANVGYRRCFHHSTEISLHFSFLSSPFELESTPHLHFALIFWYRRFDSVQWVQIKVASLDLLCFLKGKTVDIVFNVRISAVSK